MWKEERPQHGRKKVRVKNTHFCAEMFGIIKCAEAMPHTRRPERRKEGERIAGANDDKR